MSHTEGVTPTKLLILGYIGLIAVGTLLLLLPAASRSGESAGLVDALFTATSATCVTGLVVRDTYWGWSVFGQVVILILIQIGGLGFVTTAIAMITFTGRKIGIRQRFMMQASIAAPQLGGIVRLARFVALFAISCELIGAVFLSFHFIPLFGVFRGIWFSVFHAVSAFCNAGFDLMGMLQPGSSLIFFADEPLVVFPILALIILGGLGFFVWDDVRNHQHRWNKYRLQTKMVLVSTFMLIIVAFLLIQTLEINGTAYAGKPMGVQFLITLFQAVTPRTAGFNTIPIHLLSDATILLMCLLMLVGGSPGSTAGGIKTTTLVVLLLGVRTIPKKHQSIQCFGRRLNNEVFRSVAVLLTLYLGFVLAGSILLMHFDGIPLREAVFETTSAIGTVGLSLGITADLSVVSRLTLVFLMLFGRVGGLTALYAFMDSQPAVPAKYPQENVVVG